MCDQTDTFVNFAITWVQFEGWRCSEVYLSAFGKRYDHVLLAEEDVFFQTNPFLIPKPEHLPGEIYFSTSPYGNIGTDPFGNWLDSYNDSCCRKQLFDKPFLNSGLLMGSSRAMLQVLQVLVEHWRTISIPLLLVLQTHQKVAARMIVSNTFATVNRFSVKQRLIM